MTDRELIYIKTIADCKSFSKAAKKLYMTQPSLSKCVANIEQEMGTPLFLRSTKGLTLTFAGERYCQAANQILDIYSDMTQEICEMGELKHGRLRLGITNYLSSWFLPYILPEFHKRYPGINISLSEKNSAEVESALVERQIDFALLHVFEGLQEEKLPSLDFMPLCTYPFVIVLPKGSSLESHCEGVDEKTGLKILDPKYLNGQKFIMGMPEQRIRQVSDMVLRKANVSPKILLITRNFDTARRLADKGMGVAIIPWQYVVLTDAGKTADYFAIPASYKAEWTLCIATAKGTYISKACAAFIEMCRETNLLG